MPAESSGLNWRSGSGRGGRKLGIELEERLGTSKLRARTGRAARDATSERLNRKSGSPRDGGELERLSILNAQSKRRLRGQCTFSSSA